MKINILRLKNAPGSSLPFNIMQGLETTEMNGQEFNFVNPVEIKGEVTNQNNLFLVRGLAKATISTTCAKCLEPFELKLKAKLDETYTQENDGIGAANEDLIVFHGDIIDIEPEVIKSLLMELPMKLVCSPTCRGLCPQCGTNLNLNECDCQNDHIDPRLAILKKFKQ